MIPEREREALMRLTMCAREECSMCKFQDDCSFDFQRELATKNMNILADALNADRKTESDSEIPNNCEDLQDWKDRMWAEAIVTEPTGYNLSPVDKDINVRSKDEPQTDGILFKGNLKEGDYKLIKTTNGWVLEGNDIAYCGEPQTERSE